jgi:hypothetical protein
MQESKFKEIDKKNIVEFLNFISIHAKFELNTQDIIKYFKLLNYMQAGLLPKIDANLFEIEEVNHKKDE